MNNAQRFSLAMNAAYESQVTVALACTSSSGTTCTTSPSTTGGMPFVHFDDVTLVDPIRLESAGT